MDARSTVRRGALLLLVLGVLTLFLLMGTMMLTLATRTRTTAKAFAAVTAGQAARPLLARRQLEQALLALVRGGPDAQAAGMTESLLGDMYGTALPLEGRATSLVARGPLLEATVQMTGSSVRASDLCGRVITFKPAPESGDTLSSLRVLRASGTGALTCWMSRLQSDVDAPLPRVPCVVLVNQPAFRSEAYDAYDPANEWLTEVRLRDGMVSEVPHPAFETNNVNVPAEFIGSHQVSAVFVRVGDVITVGQPIASLRSAGGETQDLVSPKAGRIRKINIVPGSRVEGGYAAVSLEAAAQVDNDNDGVNDGVWLTDMFGSLPIPGGGYFKFDASYLVLDLDSRINVNAHGSRTSLDYPAADGWWTKAPDVATGSGYGPADVDASLVFIDPLRNNMKQTDPPAASDRWRRIVGEAPVNTLTATTAKTDQRRPVALVGPVDGRYGVSAVPGTTGNDLLSQRSEILYGNNPLVDLKCLIKTQMETTGGNTGPAVPKMIYYCPDWTNSSYINDPYEMRLDGDAVRPCDLRSGTAQVDSPFALADLEAVLRQFDTDAATISPRLTVALDDASQKSRMLITTDSWDTPGLTGPVAEEIATYIANLRCDPTTVISPDVLAGLRFDLNRPFLSGTAEAAAKQDYCKHLYVLLVALGQPASAATAQWAVNALDYRDPDSKFTGFQFDTDPADGWGPSTAGWSGTNTVWGAERPEVVIAQTLASRSANDPAAGELFVSLHRPWNAEMVQRNNVTAPVDVLDPALALRSGSNTLDLAKKIGNDPIWRLRFDEDSKFVRFDPPQQNDAHPAFPANCTTFTSTDKAELPPDSYLVVRPKRNASSGDISVDPGLQEFQITKGGTFRAERWSGAGNDQPGSDTMIFLERLADPESPWNASTNPYVPVDKLGIKIVSRSSTSSNNWRSFFRDPPFWRDRPFSKTTNPPKITKLDAEQTNWLPWANRAFISHAELLLVPQGNAIDMLSGYAPPPKVGNKCPTCGGDGTLYDNVPCPDCDATGKIASKSLRPYYFLPTRKLLDSTIVSSRFAGSQVSVDPASLAAVGMDKIPFNQLSRWREPGRVNLNTVVTNTNCADPQRDNVVWWATMGPDAALSRDEFTAALPAKSLADLLTLMQGEAIYLDSAAAAGVKGNSWKKNRPYDLNPAAAYTTAIRLANVATIRSHVFAVWVTLRVRDTSPGGITSYHRAFAIIDRSRPVGFADGQDLNIRDTIRVLRFLE